MYLIISSENTQNKILSIIKDFSLPIFVCFKSTDDFEELLGHPMYHIYPKSVIFEGHDLISTQKLCAETKKKYPHISVGAILSQRAIQKSQLRYIPSADCELISPFFGKNFIDFIQNLSPISLPSVSPNLILSNDSSYLLGYDMKLSPSEHRILVFLSTFNNLVLNANTICELCLNAQPTKERIATLRVMINRINKKAKNISSRPIILSSYKNGYFINPEL